MLAREPAIEGGARQEAEDRRGGRPLGVEEQEHRARMSVPCPLTSRWIPR
ncbi:unnamed protein product [Musa hybrid cultivar]